MKFAKLHGLGNDFLVVEVRTSDGYRSSLAVLGKRICDRHCGVGSDGVIFYQPTQGDPEADFSALIFNADGSRAEMSGNGIRCLAAYLIHSEAHSSKSVRIRTVSGIKCLKLERRDGLRYHFECSMGHPILDPEKIPARLGGVPGPVLNYPLRVEAEVVNVSICSMGNPHCSTFWSDVSQAPIDKLGPALECHPIFPSRTNVEFVELIERARIKVRFWERGVGHTLSSGTGSAAAAVAAILQNLADSPLTVETALGCQVVDWRHGRELRLTGPAEFICSGDYPAGDDEI